MSSSTIFAAIALCASFFWTIFLIYDLRSRPNPPSFLFSLRLLCHNIPALFLLGTAITASTVRDKGLVWFIALMMFRYWRTATQIYFWFQYKPAVAPTEPTITSNDCTVIVPTVGPVGNKVFHEMVTSILINHPQCLIFSTNTDNAVALVKDAVSKIIADIEAGITPYQVQYKLGPMIVKTQIIELNANISNKRAQFVGAFDKVDTKILISVDDTAIWNPGFLEATLPAFESKKVGLVGTRKWVKHGQNSDRPVTGKLLTRLWYAYKAGFWNCIGGIYLTRHNFEMRATNTADGGVFCVSGRTSLVRTEIVNTESFIEAFLNEYILRFGDRFPGWGPVKADDDVFITRWIINHGWDVKIQYSEAATMTTILGTYPIKFPDQCKRWSRTTFRQFPIVLFGERTIWWKWPLTVWVTYFPWMYNAALLWDSLAVYTLTRTDFYARSAHQASLIAGLILFIWTTKLVKSLPWFWAYPMDFFLYFVIPACPLFVYWHSLLKLYTAFTFWDLAWSGRKLD